MKKNKKGRREQGFGYAKKYKIHLKIIDIIFTVS